MRLFFQEDVMNEKEMHQNEEMEIDVGRLVDAVVRKSWIVLLISLLCALVLFAGTFFLVTPQYESAAMFYVNNNSLSVGDASFSLSTGDISAAKSLVESYIIILQTRTTLNDVADYAEVDRTYQELKQMISASSVNDTEIFEVVVTGPDPREAEKIANAIAYILPKRISGIIEGTSAKIVDAAVVASQPSSPSYTRNTLLGFALGFVFSVAFIAMRELFDVSVRTEDDITQCCKHPILAAVPDMTAPSKGGYYTEKKSGSSGSHGVAAKQQFLVGNEISFAASEAYKLLRTKIQYSFADNKDCYVIGVSSALSGEGKSLTAVNLAHTLSQLNKKVLLIDCDMRRPSLPAKLPIHKKPGLSGYLSGQMHEETIFQYCCIPGDEKAFHVIASGQNPPNPVELLGSAKMSKMLSELRQIYSYIILDLPPVGEVSDALAVAKETDGILLVVRQNVCNRLVLADTVRQLEFVGSRILGITFNCTTESGTGYGKKYYKKYYKAYETNAEKRLLKRTGDRNG